MLTYESLMHTKSYEHMTFSSQDIAELKSNLTNVDYYPSFGCHVKS